MKKLLLAILFTLVFCGGASAEIKWSDAFFEGGGRYSYEAELDQDGNIIQLIEINDFKNLKDSNGCFKISFFDKYSNVYKFLKNKNLNVFCNNS